MQDPAATDFPLSPPRSVSPRIRRRAWAHPTVRFWWLLALALLVLAPFVGAPPVKRWQTVSRLANQPTVQARLIRNQREAIAGRPVLPGDTVQIEIQQGDTTRQLWGTLDGWSRGPLPRMGQTIEVRLDPDNPDLWAVVHEAPPLTAALATGVAVAAIAVAPMLLSMWLRRRILNVWREGELRRAAVISRQTTALAPGAWAVRCAWVEDEQPGKRPDRAIFAVFVPKRLPATEEIAVLALPGGGKRVAAGWFE